MEVTRKVIRIHDVEKYTMPGAEDAFYSRMLIDRESVGSTQLTVNEFTLLPGQTSYKGVHPAPFDEVYYVVKGKAWLFLGDDDTKRYAFEEGMIAFIPSNMSHSLINESEENFILLTIMPQQPKNGANSLYDSRKEAWGTSFKLREGATEVEHEPVRE